MATNPIFIPRRQAPAPKAPQKRGPRRVLTAARMALTPAGEAHQAARRRAAIIEKLRHHAGVVVWDERPD